MYFEQARQYAMHRLEKELSLGLTYHRLSHTRDEVAVSAETLGRMESLDSESMELLLTAAWFHDLGYVEQAVHHELISARIALQVLPEFGYTLDQIDRVRWAILSTALPQSPSSLLEKILTDADLDILGRENFMSRNQDLRREMVFLGKTFSDVEWYSGQLKFVSEHNYFTASAHVLLDAGKLKSTAILKRALEEVS